MESGMESRYKQEVSQYGKKDGIVALCVWLVYIALSSVYVVITNLFSMPWYVFGLIVIVFCSLMVVGIAVVVKVSKQNLASIGLHKENLSKAIGLGFLFSLIPITIIAVVPGIINGFSNVNIVGLLLSLITTFFFAAHEDVVFVGLIQTRLYGLFKTNKAAICAGAILFATMHVPLWIINGRLDFNQPLVFVQAFLAWIILHIVFVSVFKKYFSLIPVFILHTLWNYSFNFARFGTIDFSLLAIAFIVLAACFLFWQSYKSEKLTSQ